MSLYKKRKNLHLSVSHGLFFFYFSFSFRACHLCVFSAEEPQEPLPPGKIRKKVLKTVTYTDEKGMMGRSNYEKNASRSLTTPCSDRSTVRVGRSRCSPGSSTGITGTTETRFQTHAGQRLQKEAGRQPAQHHAVHGPEKEMRIHCIGILHTSTINSLLFSRFTMPPDRFPLPTGDVSPLLCVPCQLLRRDETLDDRPRSVLKPGSCLDGEASSRPECALPTRSYAHGRPRSAHLAQARPARRRSRHGSQAK